MHIPLSLAGTLSGESPRWSNSSPTNLQISIFGSLKFTACTRERAVFVPAWSYFPFYTYRRNPIKGWSKRRRRFIERQREREREREGHEGASNQTELDAQSAMAARMAWRGVQSVVTTSWLWKIRLAATILVPRLQLVPFSLCLWSNTRTPLLGHLRSRILLRCQTLFSLSLSLSLSLSAFPVFRAKYLAHRRRVKGEKRRG